MIYVATTSGKNFGAFVAGSRGGVVKADWKGYVWKQRATRSYELMVVRCSKRFKVHHQWKPIMRSVRQFGANGSVTMKTESSTNTGA